LTSCCGKKQHLEIEAKPISLGLFITEKETVEAESLVTVTSKYDFQHFYLKLKHLD
jgi:hypothetical protein